MEQVLMVRELEQERAGQDRHVARRRLVALVGQAVRIGETAVPHADALGLCVHPLGEALDRAADILRDGRGDVVGRLDHEDLEGVVEADLGAGLEAHLRRGLSGRGIRHGQEGVHAQLAPSDQVERHVRRHQLGDGGRIPGVRRPFRVEDAAGFDFDDESRRTGPGRPAGEDGKGEGCQTKGSAYVHPERLHEVDGQRGKTNGPAHAS
jgi:hypothetical protein